MRLPTRLLQRAPDSHKGMFGHVFVLAGSARYSGAAVLCVSGALRCGAGLVTIGLPKSLVCPMIAIKPPEAMLLPLAETKELSLSTAAFKTIMDFIAASSVVVIGPGLGLNASTCRLTRELVAAIKKPMVIDASSLDALSGHTGILKKAGLNTAQKVITPHPAEMARLTGVKISAIQNNRKGIAKDFANEYNVTVVLKGHSTVVASPGGSLYINSSGNPGMARGGTGDILSGMIAAFIGQGLTAFEAAKYAVYLHGLAGDLAAKEKTQLGMIASDIVDKIPEAIKAVSR
jgi:ADP-dependent NAD(P)H-hydrate dehydratase / NAD(P)H-hydrate epimerase